MLLAAVKIQEEVAKGNFRAILKVQNMAAMARIPQLLLFKPFAATTVDVSAKKRACLELTRAFYSPAHTRISIHPSI